MVPPKSTDLTVGVKNRCRPTYGCVNRTGRQAISDLSSSPLDSRSQGDRSGRFSSDLGSQAWEG